MKIADLMSKDIHCVSPSDTAQHVARLLKDHNIGSVPVADSDSRVVQGIITDRDLCCTVVAEGLDPKTTTIERFFTRDPATCRADADAEECARLMQQRQIRRIPVVDDQNRCIGVVAMADLALREKPEKVSKTISEISKPSRQQPRAVA